MSACVNDKDSPAGWFDTLAVDVVVVVAEAAVAGGAEVDEPFVIDEEPMLDAIRGRVADDAMMVVTLADAIVDGPSPMRGPVAGGLWLIGVGRLDLQSRHRGAAGSTPGTGCSQLLRQRE